jgi:hypothetical protein
VSLVYKVAELRIRQRLVSTGQTVPDQVRKLILAPDHALAFPVLRGDRPAPYSAADGTRETAILRLADLHRQIVRLLGPAYEHC